MFNIKNSGSFSSTEKFLKQLQNGSMFENLNSYGRQGVRILEDATPEDTGLVKNSWSYDVTKSKGRYSIHWNNNDVEGGLNVAIILQYGHATKNGGWVEGRDYINPTMQPFFDDMVVELWKVVTKNG